EDLKMAKHRLVSDKDSPYYSLLLDTKKELYSIFPPLLFYYYSH
ncbi:unnamed protein product, partial [marine sediment metagenome]